MTKSPKKTSKLGGSAPRAKKPKISPSRSTGKAAANQASTGGLGVTFENRAQAVKLLHMCTGMPSPGIPDGWNIVELRYQARVHGPQTDDLVCTVRNSAGELRRVLMQMKSGLTAQKSNQAFRDAIGGAWLDYQNTNYFTRGLDRIVIVHDADARHSLSGATAVAKAANMSLTSKDWLEKVETPGVGNQLKRNALSALRDIATDFAHRTIDDNELFAFLKHLSFLSHDLLHEGTAEYVQLLNWTRALFRTIGTVLDASFVWSKLVTTCNSLNGVGAGVSIESVSDVLGDELARAFKLIREGSFAPFEFGARPIERSLAGDVGISVFAATGSRTELQESVPAARDTSANKLISALLDKVNVRIKAGKYKDAMTDIVDLGQDMKLFDAHQKARWYLMRGVCNWHFDHDTIAAEDFLKAASLCDDDDKLAAARARGLLLKKDLEAAIEAGLEALERFPQSLPVWLITQNARLMKGATMTLGDIPTEHREEADAHQLVAWSMFRDGNLSGAAAVARDAMKLSTASYFTRDLALSYTLGSVVTNTLNVTFRMLTDEELGFLGEVSTAFEPHLEKLWSMQSDSTVRDTVRNLGYAYVLCERGSDALKLIEEARNRNITGPEFIHLELECYLSIEEPDRALQYGTPIIGAMSPDSLVTFAQVAATAGDLKALESALDAAQLLRDECKRTHVIELITTMRWDVMIKAGRNAEVIEGLNSSLAKATSVQLLVQASQLLRQVGQIERSNACLDSLSVQISSAPCSPAEQYLAAAAFLYGRRFEETAKIYEVLLRPGVHSQLHDDLLFCYIRLGAYAKAKKLLDSFPSRWMQKRDSRHLAIELGQLVGDWQMLAELSLVQVNEAPENAMSWLFRVMVAARQSKTELMAVLNQIPERLDGSTRELAQVAICELNNGFEERGLRRIYRMRRVKPTDADVAASYMSAIVTTKKPLPHLEGTQPEVKPGTFFTLADDDGKEITRVIDPQELADLPSEGNFRPASSLEMAPFIGSKVGAQIEISSAWGRPLVFTVLSIGSAYRYVLDDSQRVLKESIGKSTFLTVLDIPEDEKGNLDISKLEEQVLKSAEIGREIMETYRTVPMTIGATCRMLNRGVFDAICGWPNRAVELEVGGGPVAEREAAVKLLGEHKGPFVIDAATLIELGRANCLHLLARITNLICSTKTEGLIRGELEESIRLPSAGTALEHEGSMALVEVSAHEWGHRVDLLREIVAAIETYIEVKPSYGPADFKKVPQQLRDVISGEEVATVMLAVETNAVLVCMDARLRMLAGLCCGLEGVWPQTFLGWCLVNGYLSQRDYSVTCIKFFLSGRNFTSLNDTDLLYAMYQGGDWPKIVISAFSEHIAKNSVEFESALKVSISFLGNLAGSGHCQLGFLAQAASLITEGLARHKNRSTNLGERIFNELRYLQGVRTLRASSLAYLNLSIQGGIERAKRKVSGVLFKGQVLFCGNPPWLLNGLTDEETAKMILWDESIGENSNVSVASAETSGQALSDMD